MTLTGSDSWSRSDEKHPVRLWVRMRRRWYHPRKQWCYFEKLATGNEAEEGLRLAQGHDGSAHLEFYPDAHREGLL